MGSTIANGNGLNKDKSPCFCLRNAYLILQMATTYSEFVGYADSLRAEGMRSAHPFRYFLSMNGVSVKNLIICISLLLTTTLLQGCLGSGGGSGTTTNQSTVRLVNVARNYSSLDMISSTATLASGVAIGTVSSYSTVASGTFPITLDLSGSGTPSAATNLLLTSGVDYTLVAYTSGQQLQIMALTDDEVAPASGDGKIRVAMMSPDAGNVDVYATTTGVDPSTATAMASDLAGTTGYFQIPQGTYHIWVTGSGNKADLRLDIPSVVISDQQVLTLILSSTVGGTLVDGWLVTQKGAVNAQKNMSARVRLAANIAANGSIAVTGNGVSLGSMTSPGLGSYTLVPSGALSMNAVVNNNAVSAGNLNAAAGADLTLLAVGNAASPQFYLLNEDNNLPMGGMAKIRLVNGVNGLASNISLNADYNLLEQNVAPGTVSALASVSSGIISRLEVDSSQANTSMFLATNVNLQSQGVYSLFMLGDNPASVGILRRDR